jgi:MerR family transcriptional regulator/heat shock protein HspR
VRNGKDILGGDRHRDECFPKYSISVVVVMTGVHAHTLRQYEQHGLLEPARTEGRTRRYSDRDLETIREIARLARKGVNYAGIQEVLRLRRQWHEMKSWPGDDGEHSSRTSTSQEETSR